jgi:hypothetical protein
MLYRPQTSGAWLPLSTDRAPIPSVRKRDAHWLKPELVVGVRHLRGSGGLRHATVQSVEE